VEGWLKGLIAAACVVVIAAGVYYGWGEYKKHQRAAEIEAGRESARQEILELAGAKSFEIDKIRAFCKRMSDKRYREDDNSEFVRILVGNCSGLGYD
jgi:predicted negative regulator of RcsB-dependent stress response